MNEPDHTNPNHPGPGWTPVPEGGLLKEGDIFWNNLAPKQWSTTEEAGRSASAGLRYFRRIAFPPMSLSPEEQAVIDAMRAGRKPGSDDGSKAMHYKQKLAET